MSYLTRAMGKPRFERIFRKMGKLPAAAADTSYEKQGTAYDPGARGHELQGRAGAPSAKMTAASVLALVDEMKDNFMGWKALAADVLGADIPSKKKDIIEALEAKAKEV